MGTALAPPTGFLQGPKFIAFDPNRKPITPKSVASDITKVQSLNPSGFTNIPGFGSINLGQLTAPDTIPVSDRLLPDPRPPARSTGAAASPLGTNTGISGKPIPGADVDALERERIRKEKSFREASSAGVANTILSAAREAAPAQFRRLGF